MISYSLINHDVAIKLIIPKRMYIHIQNCLCMCIEISPAEWRTSKNGFWFSCHDILTWFYSCVDIFSISIISLLYYPELFKFWYLITFIYYISYTTNIVVSRILLIFWNEFEVPASVFLCILISLSVILGYHSFL